MLGREDDQQLVIEPIVGWRGWSVRRNMILVSDSHERARSQRDDFEYLVYDQPVTHRAMLHSPHRRRTIWSEGVHEWDGVCRCKTLRIHRKYKADFERLAIQTDIDILSQQLKDDPESPVSEMLQTLLDHQRAKLKVPPQEPECHCGVNAFSSLAVLDEKGYLAEENVHAVGTVYLSGIVRAFEHGYRAQRGEVGQLWAVRAEDAGDVEDVCRELGVQYMGLVSRYDG